MTKKVKIGLITGVSILMLLIVLLFTRTGDASKVGLKNKKGVKVTAYSNWNE